MKVNQVRNNPSPFFKGEVVKNLKCIDVSNLGYGVFKVDNYTIFARNVIVDEVCDLEIVEVKKKFSIARVTKLIETSSYRNDKYLDYSHKYNNTRYLDFDYPMQVKIKENQMSKLFNQEVSLTQADNLYHYRNKSEFIYQNEVLNMYNDKKELTPVTSCLLAHDEINNVLAPTVEALNNNKRANISNVIFRYSRFEHKIMIILVSESENRHQLKIAQEIVGYSDKVKSVILNVGDSSNYLFNDKEIVLYGSEYLIDTLFNKQFKLTSKSFYQINYAQTLKLYQTVIDFADFKKSDNVADLYCGVGTIGIIVSDYVNHVLGVEVVSDAVKAAQENINLNEKNNVDIIEHDLNEDFSILEDIDVAIVDPPRSGLSKKMIENLVKSEVSKIVYVSCDPYTQKRDLNIFESNGYKLEKIKAVDMFVHTHHVETVVLMSRVDK